MAALPMTSTLPSVSIFTNTISPDEANTPVNAETFSTIMNTGAVIEPH